MITDEMLRAAAAEADQAILDSLPLPHFISLLFFCLTYLPTKVGKKTKVRLLFQLKNINPLEALIQIP